MIDAAPGEPRPDDAGPPDTGNGAAGTADPQVQPPSTSATGSRALLLGLIVIAVVAYLADLATKTLAVRHLDPGEPVSIIGDTVTLHLVRNSGAAFSMATGYTWVLTLIALVVVGVIIRFSRRLRSPGWAIGLGLVLGGALGNLTDRMFREPGPLRGHVVDFVSVGWWPVFNVADSAVVCGAVLLVVLTLLGYDYDGTRSGWAARHTASASQGTNDDVSTDGDGNRDA
ncbi:lipoprotein signal peptidase [Gordonia hirsuta DSM 44140 = NBRC 16056]|uniref:Lipoprotein signal peptidase n=1 Tax=Gordonia hirsuta DSM 44140 = NBRC 16056 TaxID=1121927 RepID=L7L4L7_9ACTN|nr:signal peptidase II [Gordonia hirsuta]GAC55894.1 lipoprotein signal peptidase [Gordonia hirsuta DSM 44140 = NBRC 16056]